MHKAKRRWCTVCAPDMLLHHRDCKKGTVKTGKKQFCFFFSVLIERKKWENETKQNKTHKNGNEKINFHLNGCLHINATYTLHTYNNTTVSVSDFPFYSRANLLTSVLSGSFHSLFLKFFLLLLELRSHPANVNKSQGILSTLICSKWK